MLHFSILILSFLWYSFKGCILLFFDKYFPFLKHIQSESGVHMKSFICQMFYKQRAALQAVPTSGRRPLPRSTIASRPEIWRAHRLHRTPLPSCSRPSSTATPTPSSRPPLPCRVTPLASAAHPSTMCRKRAWRPSRRFWPRMRPRVCTETR